MSSAFIDDGYTESGYIAEIPRLHPSLSFEYRPMLATERNRAADEAEKPNADPTKVMVEWLAKKLVTWSLDRKPDAAALSRLRPKLLTRLYAVVAGNDASDALPDGPAPEKVDMDAEGKG